MKPSSSIKFRAVGGASVIALSVGFSAPAMAQSAPAPLMAPPAAPTIPAEPANTEQCVQTGSVITCAPGVDPDGAGENPFNAVGPDGPLVITVDEGAFVKGRVTFGAIDTTDSATLTNNGTIVGDNSGVAMFSNGTLTNNGFIFGNGFSGFDSLDNITITNNGTIAGLERGIASQGGFTLVNNGLVQSNGPFGTIIIGNAFSTDPSSITNSVTGSIIGANSTAIISATDLNLINAGLIQSFGAGNDAVNVSGDLDLRNTGNIVAESGNAVEATGVTTIRNLPTGLISSGADDAIVLGSGGSFVLNNGTVEGGLGAVDAGSNTDITVVNNGTMSGRRVTVRAGDNLLVVNRGDLTTTERFVIATTDNFELRNLGNIVSGDGIAVRAGADFLIENRGGTISSANNRALFVGGAGIITNEAGGVISGDIGIDASFVDGLNQVFNAGTLTGTGGTAALLGGGNDVFYTINAGTENGIVDGQAGGDTLVVLVTDDQRKVFNLSNIDTQYLSFERFVVGTQNFDAFDNTVSTLGTGELVLTGTTDKRLLIRNEAVLAGTLTNTARLVSFQNPNGGPAQELRFLVAPSGSINVTGGNAIELLSDGFLVLNSGTITSDESAFFANGINDLTIVNNNTISGRFATIRSGDGLFVVNRGTLEATTNFAIATGDGFELRNLGTISANGVAVRAAADSLIENRSGGTIVSAANRALLLGGASVITNEAGALISGTEAIDASFGSETQQVVNFGTITGTDGTAVDFGDGADEFQQWSGAVVNGDLLFGLGDDTFVLEGAMSSINGTVFGGDGSDTSILGGMLDADNLDGFETHSLGGLFDLRVSGARSLTGNASFDGNVTFALGMDTLDVDGNTTLASGGVITVLTPMNEALIGQTIKVFDETGTFTNNGGTVNIIDDDLLIDYTPVLGSLFINVTAANPLTNSSDPNVVRFAGAVAGGLNAGTLSSGTFGNLNSLSASQYESALLDGLPSLSEGVGREIFETSSAASGLLDRHLTTEGSSLWGQVIIRGSEQDALSLSAAGYDSDQLVFTVGGDIAVTDGAKLGVMVSFADIDVTDFAANSAAVEQQVDSLKLGAYAAVSLFDRGFFNAEVAYLSGDVESSRNGLLGMITSGYDFDGIAARATLGYDVLPDENVWFTPSIGVNFANISFDDATEAGGLGFTVERGDAEFFELRAGAEVGAEMSDGVSGFISGHIVHDTVNSVRSFRLSSSQLSTFFAELPMREQDRFELSAGLDAQVSDSVSFGVGYQGDFNSGYSAHSARATLSVSF